jgi:hypothetical protein
MGMSLSDGWYANFPFSAIPWWLRDISLRRTFCIPAVDLRFPGKPDNRLLLSNIVD